MNKKTIEFLDVRHIRGPNIWTYRPIIEARIDIGDLEDCPSNTIPGYYERLTRWLPSLIEHRCSYEERGGFLRRLEEGTWPAHIMEHVTLELQNLAGLPGGFGRARETPIRGVYKVMIRAHHPDITIAAMHTARNLMAAAMEDTPFDVPAAIADLIDLVEKLWLGPSTASIVQAAQEREIPFIRLNDANLVQLGYGTAQRRIWTAETDNTSAIAEGISRDKDLTKTLLSTCGLPIPEGRLVDSPEDAWAAAEEIGVPVVIKPYDGNHGRGVFIDLMTREQVLRAYEVALEEGSGVIVERCIQGSEHRLLVIGGKLIAASKGDEAKITGDGKSTIYELIQSQINADPRRGYTEEDPLTPVRINSASLLEITRQGYADENAIPPSGVEVIVQRTGNHAFDVTDDVHPEIAETVALAARVVGLDIAGVDLVVKDISRPLAEQGGAIVEVNAGPGFIFHLKPAVGKPRPVGQAVVNELFHPGETGRIPVVGISGSHGRTLVAKLIARLLRLGGKQTGLACAEGLFIGQRLIEAGDCACHAPAQRLLMNRNIEAMVCETSHTRILREGLPYDRCQIGVVTGIDTALTEPDDYMETPEQLFTIVRTQMDVVLPNGVGILNADDPLVADMARLCDGEVIFFGLDPQNPVLLKHRASGGRAVTVREGALVLCAETEEILIPVGQLPEGAAAQDTLGHVLAGAAGAWALGISRDLLRAGLETFDQTLLARIAG